MAAGWMFVLTWLVQPTFAAPDGSAEVEAQARQLYIEGDAHYAAGRYEEAAQHFQQAYNLSGRPVLLYNLANVYERMSDYVSAADCLRRYLDSSEVHDVVSVRERLRRLELTISTARPETGPPETFPPASEPVRSPPWPGVVLGAATAGAAVSAVTFGLLTNDARLEAATLCGASPEGVTLCRADAVAPLERERNLSLATDISIGATAALGTATVVYFATRAGRKGRQSDGTRVSLVPSWRPGGAQLVLSAVPKRAVRPQLGGQR
ncbi:MAG: tetratricopeptide repeat protein [Myxococcota bacterium]